MYIIVTVGFLHDINSARPSEWIRVTGVRRTDVDGHHDTVFGWFVQHLELGRVTLVPVDVYFFYQVVSFVQRHRATTVVVGLDDDRCGGGGVKTAHRGRTLIPVRLSETLLFQRQRYQPTTSSKDIKLKHII